MARIRLSRGLTLIAALVVAGCANPSASSPASLSPTSTSSSSSAASPSVTVDLTDLDLCPLLDDETVRTLAGWPADVRVESDGSGTNPVKCFWGAAQAGVPGYVEISVGRTTGLPPHADCTVVPETGIGTEAQRATCSGDNLFLEAFDGGLMYSIQVQSKTPGDLAPALTMILDEVNSR